MTFARLMPGEFICKLGVLPMPFPNNHRDDPEFKAIANKIKVLSTELTECQRNLDEKFPLRDGWGWGISAAGTPVPVYVEKQNE